MWKPIERSEYFESLRFHKDELSVYESCTDIDFVLTVWGFKGKELEFIKAVDQLMYDEVDEYWQYRYYKWTN